MAFVVAAGIERRARRARAAATRSGPLPTRRRRSRSTSGPAPPTRRTPRGRRRRRASGPRTRSSTSRSSQAVADLKALTVYHFGAPVVSAGIPWYTCPFGRDALITGFEALLAAPDVARDALRFLARLQGTRDDPTRDEEPGKIPHEIRFGEMAAAGEVPHTPYYGSADATPLFLVLLDEYERGPTTRETVDALLPAAEAALGWLDRQARTATATASSSTSAATPSGAAQPGLEGQPRRRAVRGRHARRAAHRARRGAGLRGRRAPPAWPTLYERRGRHAEAGAAPRPRARRTREAIEARFWMEAKGTYAIALDRDKRQVDAVTSNPGPPPLLAGDRGTERARVRGARRSSGREMWSGWGIRTLAAGQPAYNPLSYHDGTVWPHDNALCAAGLAAYGHDARGGRGAHGPVARGAALPAAPAPGALLRPRRADGGEFPVHYPVACSPQAWSIGGVVPPAARRARHLPGRAGADAAHRLVRSFRRGSTRSCSRGSASGPRARRSGSCAGPKGAFPEVVDVTGGPLQIRHRGVSDRGGASGRPRKGEGRGVAPRGPCSLGARRAALRRSAGRLTSRRIGGGRSRASDLASTWT